MPYKTTEEINNKILDICTYHSDDGTSGYSLSSIQFQKLFALINTTRSQDIAAIMEWAKKKQERWQDHYGHHIAATVLSDVLTFLSSLQDTSK